MKNSSIVHSLQMTKFTETNSILNVKKSTLKVRQLKKICEIGENTGTFLHNHLQVLIFLRFINSLPHNPNF